MLYNHFLTRPLEILLFLFLFVRSSGQFGLVSVQRANKPTTWAIEAFLCIKIDNLINCVGSDLRSTMDRLLWGRFVGLTMMKNASLIYNQHFPLVSKLWVQSRSNPLEPQPTQSQMLFGNPLWVGKIGQYKEEHLFELLLWAQNNASFGQNYFNIIGTQMLK